MPWLIVVHHDQRELYEALRRSLPADSKIVVIYDRRVGERRRGGDGPKRERRRTDRRRRRPTAFVYQGQGDMITPSTAAPSSGEPRSPAAPRHGTAACAHCGQSLEFELPRFPQAPSRLEIEVLHSMAVRGNVQHQVELSAFSGSGRPLLTHRTQATAAR